MNNKVVIGGNLKLKNVVSGQANLNNVISGTPKSMIQVNGRGSGLTDAVKVALLDCFQHVAWVDEDGQDYYDALYDALYAQTVVSITAVFEQGQAVIYSDDSLNDLKQYLTVTANYDDGTTAVVTGYTLSGTLTAGTSTIQVTYEGKKAYFNVTVTERPALVSISAVYTQSGTVYEDTPLNDLKSDLVVTATYSDSSTETVPSADYTLSGTLTAGTSTITVSYSGKTTTFNVTVSTNMLYELPNTPMTFTGTQSECVDSGFVLFPTDRDLTMTMSFNPTSSSLFRTLFYAGSTESPYYSTTIRAGGQANPKGVWRFAAKSEYNTGDMTNITLNEVNKVVVRHHAGTLTFEIDYYNESTGKTSIIAVASGEGHFIDSNTMRIGGARSSGTVFNSYAFVGEISNFVVYEGYLSDAKVNEYLGVE